MREMSATIGMEYSGKNCVFRKLGEKLVFN
jgi:hypothetical protein